MYFDNKWIIGGSKLNKSQLKIRDKTTEEERESIYNFLNDINDIFISHQGFLKGGNLYKRYKKDSLYYIRSCLELTSYIDNVVLINCLNNKNKKHFLFLEVFSISIITFLHEKYKSLLDNYMLINNHRINFYTNNESLLFPESSFDYDELFYLVIHNPLKFKGEKITILDTMKKISDDGYSHIVDTILFIDYVIKNLTPSINIIIEKYLIKK